MASEATIALPLKDRFPRSRDVVYLDTAAEGLPPDSAEQALVRYFRDKSLGTPGRRQLFAVEREAVGAAARLLGANPANVALVAHASDALNLLANSIPWQAGDEVLICDLEFPSNVLPWLRLRDMGVTVRVAPSESGVIAYDRLASQIHARTKLVSISAVSYLTGTRMPYLAQLAHAARNAGAIFAVDATQALGRIPVSLEGVDYLVASSYKWLLGTHGLGIVYLAPEFEERLVPRSVGWYSVQDIFTEDRFQAFRFKRGAARLATGMPNFPAVYALREGLDLLNLIGVDRIEQELRPLVQQLRTGLELLGVRLLTPAGLELASGIVSFAHPKAEAVGAALERAGVIVWSGDGRVRASVHLYNDSADVACFLSQLGPILTQLEKSA
jgi:cysteine desulfurase / selenocysteine lyase